MKIVQPLHRAYRWRYLLLAVAPLTGARRWAWIGRRRQADLVPVLQTWTPPCLVWDGAPRQRGKAVAALPGPRVPLPADAPALHPAARIFEEVRARVEGVVYDTLDATQAVADAYRHALQRDPARVKRRCGWAWLTTARRAISLQAP